MTWHTSGVTIGLDLEPTCGTRVSGRGVESFLSGHSGGDDVGVKLVYWQVLLVAGIYLH